MSFEGHARQLAEEQARKSREWDELMARQAQEARIAWDMREQQKREEEQRKRRDEESRRLEEEARKRLNSTLPPYPAPTYPPPAGSTYTPSPAPAWPLKKKGRKAGSAAGSDVWEWIVNAMAVAAAAASMFAAVALVLLIPFGLGELAGYRIGKPVMMSDNARILISGACGLAAAAGLIVTAVKIPKSKKAWLAISLGTALLMALIPGGGSAVLLGAIIAVLALVVLLVECRVHEREDRRADVLRAAMVALAIGIFAPLMAGFSNGLTRSDAPASQAVANFVSRAPEVPTGLGRVMRSQTRQLSAGNWGWRAAGLVVLIGAALLMALFVGMITLGAFAVPHKVLALERAALPFIGFLAGAGGTLALVVAGFVTG